MTRGPDPATKRRPRARSAAAGAALAVAAGLLVWAAAPAAAQQQEGEGRAAVPEPGAPGGWIGVGLEPRLRCPSASAVPGGRLRSRARGGDEGCRRALLVETVVVGEPADRAGIAPGDTILAVNGRPVFDGDGDLRLPNFRPGEELAVSVATSSGRRTAIVRAAGRPAEPGLVPVKVRARGVRPVRVRGGAEPGTGASRAVTVRIAPIGAIGLPGPRTLRPPEPEAPDPRLARIRDSVLSEATAYLDSLRGSFRAELRGNAGEERTPADLRRDLERMDRRLGERIEEMTRRLAEVFRARRVWERRREAAVAAGQREAVEERIRGALRAGGRPGARGLALEEIAPEGIARMAGAELYPLSGSLAEHFEGAAAGLLVLRVIPGTPAAEAGLRPGDVVVEAAGLPVRRPVELRAVLLEHPERDSTVLRWVRRGRTVEGVFREGG